MGLFSTFTASFKPGKRPDNRGVPTVIKNDTQFLQIWFDVSTVSSVSLNSGKITSIAGQGWASTHPANASGAADRPTHSVAIQNGLNAATFDGTSDKLTINPFTNFEVSGTPISGYTMFTACKFNSTVNQRMTETNATGTSDMGFGINATGYYEYHIGGGTATSDTLADTNWHVQSFVFDGAKADGLELKAWKDNVVMATTETVAIGDSAIAGANTVVIGCTPSNTLFFNGIMGEIVFFTRALTDGEVSSVNLYLMNKWGIT